MADEIQLILPEGFKLLPLYTLCMLKTKALKGEFIAKRLLAAARHQAENSLDTPD